MNFLEIIKQYSSIFVPILFILMGASLVVRVISWWRVRQEGERMKEGMNPKERKEYEMKERYDQISIILWVVVTMIFMGILLVVYLI